MLPSARIVIFVVASLQSAWLPCGGMFCTPANAAVRITGLPYSRAGNTPNGLDDEVASR